MADIFNKEALDALDDHSEVEEMARVASPKLRLVLGAMVAMIVVVCYWCIFGTINYKVTAQGVVFPFGDAAPISVPYDGAVSRVLVSHGTTLPAGAPVMEIRNALSATAVKAPRAGVLLQTLPLSTEFKAGQPVAWMLPQEQEMAGREMLCYVTYNDLRKLKLDQQVQVTPANMERENWGYANDLLARGRILFYTHQSSVGVAPVFALHVGGGYLYLLVKLELAQIVVGNVAQHLAPCHFLLLRQHPCHWLSGLKLGA